MWAVFGVEVCECRVEVGGGEGGWEDGWEDADGLYLLTSNPLGSISPSSTLRAGQSVRRRSKIQGREIHPRKGIIGRCVSYPSRVLCLCFGA